MAQGITPTFSGDFDVDPTSLNNITDEDLSTSTNTFTGTDGSSGFIKIDLGFNGIFRTVGVKYDRNSANGGDTYKIEISDDDSSWTELTSLSAGVGVGTISAFEEIDYSDSNFRYVRFNMTRTGGGANSAKFYEFSVL